MTLPRVKDHVDVISSDYFKELIRRYLNRLGYYLAPHPEWDTLYNQIQALPEPKYGDPVRPSYVNVLADACEKMCSHHGISPPAGLRRVSNLMWVRADDINALVDCIETLEQLPPPAPVIYLFNTNDWSTAKQYVTNDAIIFCTFGIDTLTSDEVATLVANKKVVFAIEVDTEPYRRLKAPAWYNVFYTTLTPVSGLFDYNVVEDPDFRQFFGSSVPAEFDFFTYLGDKVSEAKNWARWTGWPLVGWSYKRYEQGAIIEVPCDGIWNNVDWLGRYVDAISSILLGVSRPARILYLGTYVSDEPWWHACYPMDECWKALAQARGWSILDLRS
jgi:hypothetical protein